jgi:putative DNA primase/helicase
MPIKDISDFLSSGGTGPQLMALLDKAPIYTPPAEALVPDLTSETDSGMAEFFAALHANDLRYDHRIGRWLLWRDHSWRGDSGGEVNRLVLAADRKCYGKLGGMELEDRDRRYKFLKKCESAERRSAVVRLAKDTLPVADTGEAWDLKPDLLGVRNGVIELPTATLRKGIPDDRITLALDIDYDPDAQAPRWEQFISEVFPDADLAAFMHRSVGYSLTGQTKEQCFFLCYGKGSNGKSVLLNVMANLLGPLLVNVPFSTFLAPRAGMVAPTNDLAGLLAKRVVTAAETSDKSHLNEARLKSMTGGDPITARFLYHEYFTYAPTCKIWLAVNHRPRVADDSLGFWRRVRLIPFERTFAGAEIDQDLCITLATELPGILAWAVAGAIEWYGGGLRPPSCVLAQTAAYQKTQDPLDEFLTAVCEFGPDWRVQSAVIGGAYAAWADGLHYGPRDRLGRHALDELLDGRFGSMKLDNRKFYPGLRLRQTREPGESE